MSFVEVRFEDNSAKKFPWTAELTVEELLQKIFQKMYIKTDMDSFALFDSWIQDGYQYGLSSNILSIL